jgi:hypothetical protein
MDNDSQREDLKSSSVRWKLMADRRRGMRGVLDRGRKRGAP